MFYLKYYPISVLEMHHTMLLMNAKKWLKCLVILKPSQLLLSSHCALKIDV